MSDGRASMSPMHVVLILLGILLLLPGLCTVFYAFQVIAAGDLVRLVTRDPYFQLVLFVWIISLLISLGGVFLIRYALRRSRSAGR